MRAKLNRIVIAYAIVIIGLAAFNLYGVGQTSREDPRVWMHQVRIGAYGLTPDNAQQIVDQARSSWVYRIEVDNDIPGLWIADHEDILSAPRVPLGAVGVYFSEQTRNYYPKEFVPLYRGVLLLLLRKHIQFQIVTPRTLRSFHGSTLVLPDVHLLTTTEENSIRMFYNSGGRLVLTGHSVVLLKGPYCHPRDSLWQ